MENFKLPEICRLCRFAVTDGGIRLSRVQLDKVSDWLKDKTGVELSFDQIPAEDDVRVWWICQFCSWDARFLHEHQGEEVNQATPVWWPTKTDIEYEKYYKGDLLKPCCVRLEKCFAAAGLKKETMLVEESEPDLFGSGNNAVTSDGNCTSDLNAHFNEIEPKSENIDDSVKKVPCIYCLKIISSPLMGYHTKKWHSKVAIKCEYGYCPTYFHSDNERNNHYIKEHQQATRNGISPSKWMYCKKWFSALRNHIIKRHRDIAIRCDHKSCPTYFHTMEEKQQHLKERHVIRKRGVEFPCLFCSNVLQSHNTFHIHTRVFHKSVAYFCLRKRCRMFFKTQSGLDAHVKLHCIEDAKKTLKCTFCDFKTAYTKSLKIHIADHKNSFFCADCNKVFCSRHKIIDHLKICHLKRTCLHCQLKVPLKLYNRHMLVEHCRICSAELLCAGLKKRHLLKCKRPNFQCEVCPAQFEERWQLKYHINYKHKPGSENKWQRLEFKSHGLKCEKCRKYFKNEKALQAHKTNFHLVQRKKMTCDVCKKHFYTKKNLKSHFSSAHTKIYACLRCPKTFTNWSVYISHWKFQHRDGCDVAECPQCGKFMSPPSLENHIRNMH